MGKITIYSDGACRGNGKKDAMAVIGIHSKHQLLKLDYVAEIHASKITNERAELIACITGIEIATTLERKNDQIEVKVDSAYVSNSQNTYIENLRKNGWKRKDHGKV